MPAETASTASTRRTSAGPRESAASYGDSSEASSKHTGGHQKHSRHVVGHSRLGTRNPSFGRNLSKATSLASKDEEGSSLPRDASMLSPKAKSLVKRNHSLAGIMPKSASHVALRKNHSSGHLVRNSSAKQLSRANRPEVGRSNSQPHVQKAKRRQSPARAIARQQAVHFDVGSDDEAEGMEGVDDGWTEESVSPTTTRDNTRANTRRGSMVHHVEHKQPENGEIKPSTADTDHRNDEEKGIQVQRREEPTGDAHMTAQRSSYHESAQHKPLDADDIAKRLLQKQKQNQTVAPPLLSDVSISASTEALDSRTVVARENGTPMGTSSVETPLISRFTDSNGALGSKDGTPVDGANFTSQSGGPLKSPFQPTQKASRSPTHSYKASSDIKRNQSLPSFMTSQSPNTEGGSTSGTTTPGGLGHGGRIQQKMWLQRGLSEMESRSQQNLHGMLTPGGRTQRLGAQPDQSERIETELKVVRRYRHPVEESMERLRKLKDGPLAEHASPGKRSRAATRDGTRTPGGASIRHTGGSPPTPGGPVAGGATFTLTAADDDGATLVSFRSGRDWDKMGVDDFEALRELEEATLDVRRQMWELQLGEE